MDSCPFTSRANSLFSSSLPANRSCSVSPQRTPRNRSERAASAPNSLQRYYSRNDSGFAVPQNSPNNAISLGESQNVNNLSPPWSPRANSLFGNSGNSSRANSPQASPINAISLGESQNVNNLSPPWSPRGNSLFGNSGNSSRANSPQASPINAISLGESQNVNNISPPWSPRANSLFGNSGNSSRASSPRTSPAVNDCMRTPRNPVPRLERAASAPHSLQRYYGLNTRNESVPAGFRYINLLENQNSMFGNLGNSSHADPVQALPAINNSGHVSVQQNGSMPNNTTSWLGNQSVFNLSPPWTPRRNSMFGNLENVPHANPAQLSPVVNDYSHISDLQNENILNNAMMMSSLQWPSRQNVVWPIADPVQPHVAASSGSSTSTLSSGSSDDRHSHGNSDSEHSRSRSRRSHRSRSRRRRDGRSMNPCLQNTPCCPCSERGGRVSSRRHRSRHRRRRRGRERTLNPCAVGQPCCPCNVSTNHTVPQPTSHLPPHATLPEVAWKPFLNGILQAPHCSALNRRVVPRRRIATAPRMLDASLDLFPDSPEFNTLPDVSYSFGTLPDTSAASQHAGDLTCATLPEISAASQHASAVGPTCATLAEMSAASQHASAGGPTYATMAEISAASQHASAGGPTYYDGDSRNATASGLSERSDLSQDLVAADILQALQPNSAQQSRMQEAMAYANSSPIHWFDPPPVNIEQQANRPALQQRRVRFNVSGPMRNRSGTQSMYLDSSIGSNLAPPDSSRESSFAVSLPRDQISFMPLGNSSWAEPWETSDLGITRTSNISSEPEHTYGFIPLANATFIDQSQLSPYSLSLGSSIFQNSNERSSASQPSSSLGSSLGMDLSSGVWNASVSPYSSSLGMDLSSGVLNASCNQSCSR